MSDLIRKWNAKPVIGIVAVVAGAIGLYGILSNEPAVGNDCRHSLRHVYHAQRLAVIATCQTITFQVVAWRKEHDGDVHVNGTASGGGWTDPANDTGQHGYTVVEFVPGDPRPARFFGGQVLLVTVTKVYDEGHRPRSQSHGWIEGHPVFAVKDVTPPAVVPRSNNLTLAPATEAP